MTITAQNILYHEIVGLYANILESSDVTIRGLAGRIIGETRNTITFQSNSSRTVQVAKNIATKIGLELDSGVCFISGSSLIGKPEDRLARLH